MPATVGLPAMRSVPLQHDSSMLKAGVGAAAGVRERGTVRDSSGGLPAPHPSALRRLLPTLYGGLQPFLRCRILVPSCHAERFHVGQLRMAVSEPASMVRECGSETMSQTRNSACEDHCVGELQGEQLAQGGAEPRGALQAALVAALRACPSAVAIFDAEGLVASPEVLPVLITALSEHGHFQDSGTPQPTGNAMYIVVMAAPPAVLAAAGNEDAFKSAAKSHFVNMLSSGPLGRGAAGLAEVLRRRLDFVAPLGMAAAELPAVRTTAAVETPAADTPNI